jgi:hypothetical protein
MQKITITGLFWLLILAVQFPALGQAKLEKMLKDREKLHQEWKASESKKSGIFGNRTKKDMIETHEWMSRIIHKDNLIMEELKLLSEIEKTEITYEKNDYKFIVQKQEREITILKKALEEKEMQLSETSSSLSWIPWSLLGLFLFTGLGLRFWRKKRLALF